MTAWDGSGTDPWLPARLAARAQSARIERDVRAAYLAELSGWLVKTGRRVLRTGMRPDVDEVHAMIPAWRAAMSHLAHGEIWQALKLAYSQVLGDDYPWQQRAFVSRYLTEVTNRLVRVPDEVYSLIAAQVAQGSNLGEGIPKLAARVDNILSTSGSDRWPNRATVVARTETIGALNAARNDAFKVVADDPDEPELVKMWLATDDSRTRPDHREAEGQRVALDRPFIVGGFPLQFPGDPSGPPQEVIQCVPYDTVVRFPGLRSAMRRRYKGEMVRVELATGDKLTITPNHPVLRADGLWTPAGEIHEGDQLVRALPEREFPGEPYPGHAPSEIGKVYSSSRLVAMSDRIPLTPPDLHGDAPRGQVEVVPVDRYLGRNYEAATDQQVEEFGLTLADLATLPGGCADHGAVPGRVTGGQIDLPASGVVGGAGESQSLGGAELSHAEPVGLAGGPDFQADLGETPDDDRAADPQGSGHTEDALPPFVALAEVVKVERFTFQGHVFNLDTGHGWYSANSIITRNCRCVMLLVEPDEDVDMSDRQTRR